MKWTVTLLAAVLLLVGVAGCGEDSAEPGAPKGATVVLDFTPNAVHTGIYAASAEGFYRDAGVDLKIQQPGESSDAPKLLAAGRTDFAVLDIHDLGIARERGLDLVGVMPIVGRPLAAVIARRDGPIDRPRDLEGHTVGVSGLPSDEAVVDSEVAAEGGDPALVDRVTIGFNAVSALAAGRVDAVTGFWNSEAVALRDRGVKIRIFKVDGFAGPHYPELVLTTSRRTLERDPALVRSVVAASRHGYFFAGTHPGRALDDLLEANPALNRSEQARQLHALLPNLYPEPFNLEALKAWAVWDLKYGLLKKPIDVTRAFDLG